MPAAILHFFDPDEPNGSTIFECDTDDQFLKSLELDIQRDSLGSGKVNFARKVPAGGLFNRQIVVPEALVRVVIPSVHATKYLAGFFINPRQQQVVSRAEQGGEGFTFAGPGPKHYLERMVLWSASFAGFDNAVEKENHIWTWPSTARAGAILARLILEDQANPSGPFLPDLTKSFSDNDDSDNVPWADDIAGNQDFTLKIGDDYLRILWLLEDASGITTQIDLGEIGDPLLQLDAYQTFGRDLTGPIGPDTVHFTEGVNIATDLDVEGSSYHKASHALVEGDDGVYELAVKNGWSSGQLRKVVKIKYNSARNDLLDAAGVRWLARQDNGERQIDLRFVPGFDPSVGLYMPGPEGTDGHFWVGDTVDLTTGPGTVLDYSSEAQAVTGIQLELEKAVRDDTDLQAARSFHITAILNEERKSSGGSSDLAGTRGTVTGPPPPALKLCRAANEGSSETYRFYPQNGAGAINPGEDAVWDGTSPFTTSELLGTSADATANAVHTSTGGGGSSNFDQMLYQGVWQINAALASVLAAGGATFSGQFTTHARHGIGVNDGAQNLISQNVVRVFNSGGTLRGVALAGHALTSDAGCVEWHAHTVGKNAAFPPAAQSGVLSAVSGTVNGDYLVVELGYKNFTVPSTSGGSLRITGNAASDLPVDETTQDWLNGWIQIQSDAVGASDGDLPFDTVRQGDESAGTSTRVSRCDHQHAHGLLAADGTTYHDLAAVANYIVDAGAAPTVNDDSGDGYTLGTLWIDHSVSPAKVYILQDPAVGAAVWIEITPQTVSLALDDLTDVTITTPASGQLLTYNGSVWVNQALSSTTVQAAGRWEVVVSGSAPPVAVSNPADDDWVYAWVT